ncbi:MBL fold metallo-hydrolase [Aquabacterium sp. A7-Y]|uniref:MBL fold metallo-hydrolase n=1 Tax=Aquabacterium sp. A7-Y TaxID=1349605 RepID=UPI00223CD2C4|nr:MBL fold metallo-hydrolase [Aquabacterium sp. A7-Y]MCW7539455.1 MBL fold metallo-hydrolase [Aquabacterium sp. A7-Y]
MTTPRLTARTRLSSVLLAAATALSAAWALSGSGAAHAAAPQVRTQAPGYYRMMLGDFEITALSDGTATIPLDKLLKRTTPRELERLLGEAYLKPQIETSINAYLINTGSRLVLVDTGAGALFGPTAGGRLLKNIKAAGYKPEDVDLVLLTHIHGDHSGGLSIDGQPAFPNAVVRVDRHDSDFWLNPRNIDRVAQSERHSFAEAAASLGPYQAAGRLLTFEPGAEILPGVKAVAAHGHTPGHSLFEIQSRGERLLIWGDLIHAKDVQFPRPGITIRFDVDDAAAASQRQTAMRSAAREGTLIAAAHIAFPGLGRVRAAGKGFVWIPVNYSRAGLTD